jgi:tRNA(Ile)-lysidine synthase
VTGRARPLAERFARRVRAHGGLGDEDAVVVGVSGGVDSMALLHLLRFGPQLPRLRLVAAHVDHGMRPGSAGDAAWVLGVCAAWGVEARSVRLDPPPDDEAGARRRRYAFLERVRAEEGAPLTLTAHHADDQAETVLFRALRGTGIRGLRGIRERRGPALWRPLLPFTREEILDYAVAAGLAWREDPTNAHPLARNVIRNRLLPEAEARVAPGARRALTGLARRARENEEAWRSLTADLLARIDARPEDEEVSLDRAAFLGLHRAVQGRLVRTLAGRLGRPPGEAGTRSAVEFSSSGESGGEVSLGGGLTLRRELDRLVLARARAEGPDAPASIDGPQAGEVGVRLRGTAYRVRWSAEEVGGVGWREAFHVATLRFPLQVRGWMPGDRARLPYGSKKLKKLFLEARVPPGRRHRIPVVVDATGAVLWVPDVVRSMDARPSGREGVIHIRITHADSD